MKAGGSHTDTGDECVLMEVRSESNDGRVVQSSGYVEKEMRKCDVM